MSLNLPNGAHLQIAKKKQRVPVGVAEEREGVAGVAQQHPEQEAEGGGGDVAQREEKMRMFQVEHFHT